ncbi:DUF433 domain-containing protein [Haloquadratum walsbyi]|jgi:Protein of unknown function (DUF433).|uniref:DUF433 domain-containing protein n=1 Tax=Haloquadratum walsbyi J07HQW2 TaxID=1238425 RepID=U1PN74_9EURY|nr:DUF433 domain-containing protein [Haloquadratum walsbyi]ERG95197.1 MAG: protein of unknown function (DUF433) [Haloquadratum walsbyi J07HQW2]
MTQSSIRIVSELHDEPHIKGQRVTVRRIRGLVEGAGKSTEEVAAQLGVDVVDVYGALEHYHDNPEEMTTAKRR